MASIQRYLFTISLSLSLYKIILLQVEVQVIIDETVWLKSTNNIFHAIKISFIEWNITRTHVPTQFIQFHQESVSSKNLFPLVSVLLLNMPFSVIPTSETRFFFFEK